MTANRVPARLFLDDVETADLELEIGSVSVRTVVCADRSGPNEDAAAVIPIADDSLVLAVADGVGGSPAGCVASTMVVEALQRSLESTQSADAVRDVILDSLEKANTDVVQSGTRSASTVVIAEILGTQLRCYHVGDSELIAVGQRGLVKQRIIPHSPTGFAVEAGLLNEAEAMHHDQRHIIFNVVGTPGMRVDVGTAIDIAPLDTVLLCSDGVTDNLYLEEIVNLIRVGPIDQAADALMAAARARMAESSGKGPSKPDDATIVLYRRRR